jgi:hypothetical protein
MKLPVELPHALGEDGQNNTEVDGRRGPSVTALSQRIEMEVALEAS